MLVAVLTIAAAQTAGAPALEAAAETPTSRRECVAVLVTATQQEDRTKPPAFSATRTEARFSGSTISWRRARPCSAAAQRVSKRNARVATPRPRASFPTQ